MMQPLTAGTHATGSGASLLFVEGGLTLIAIATCFAWPRLAFEMFARIERLLTQVARRKHLAVAIVFFTEIILRIAILPLVPIPKPFLPDDFSFLLSAETFASGRLTNPTPPMWIHFESMHISMTPTYMSMYFPAQGLILAASHVLFGNPWFGILVVTALMCAAICWMLQAWLPSSWALLGGMLAVLHLGLFSYWVNTYVASSIAALGGAMVLGAYPRIRRSLRLRYGVIMALGMVILAMSRPYEGLLLCLPVAFVLLRQFFFAKSRPSLKLVIQRTALPLTILVAGASWMGYYDYRAFGNPVTPPYSVNRATYAVAPYYVWQKQRPDPGYHHVVMRNFYYKNELPGFTHIHKPILFLPMTLFKAISGVMFFAGVILLVPLVMVRRMLNDRRVRFLVIGIFVLSAGMIIEVFLIPHYLAPFTAAFYTLGIQAMRHLRVKKIGGLPVGMTLTRLLVVLCLTMGGLRLFALPLHFSLDRVPASEWNLKWFGPGAFGGDRATVVDALNAQAGPQLVIVRYGNHHDPMDEWVYNSADIENSKVVWAREMNAKDDSQLIQYYKNRTVWLLQPDVNPTLLLHFNLQPQDTLADRWPKEPQ